MLCGIMEENQKLSKLDLYVENQDPWLSVNGKENNFNNFMLRCI